jgi:predicted Zn-dependent peptidase
MIHQTVLDNGIRVITERIPSAHSVSIGFWVENGSRHEKPSQNGISHFLEHMLFKGTRKRSSLDIAKEIDSVGGVLNGFTSREYSCYYAKVLARKLPLAMDLLADIVLNSIFDADEIEKERKVILQEIFMLEDAPDDNIHDLFSQAIWTNHPLGLPILGTRDTVGEISRDGMLGIMAAQYCGRNTLICAAGNLQHEQIVNQLADLFSGVESGKRVPSSLAPSCRRGTNLLEKDLEQAHICLGTGALSQNHPDRFKLYLLNTILGGSMSSRLFQKVREDAGLAYSIYSYLNCHSDSGALVVYAGTSPEDAPEVVDIVLAEIRRLKKEQVTTEELHSAREQLKGNLLLSMESTDNRMTRLAKNEIYLGRQTSLKEITGELNRIRRKDLLVLADAILNDDSLNLQVIGRIQSSDFSMLNLSLQ